MVMSLLLLTQLTYATKDPELTDRMLQQLRDSVISVSVQLAAVARTLNATLGRKDDTTNFQLLEAVHELAQQQQKVAEWTGEGRALQGVQDVDLGQNGTSFFRKIFAEIYSLVSSITLFAIDGIVIEYAFRQLPKSVQSTLNSFFSVIERLFTRKSTKLRSVSLISPEEALARRFALGAAGAVFVRAGFLISFYAGGDLGGHLWHTTWLTMRVMLMVIMLFLHESIRLPRGIGSRSQSRADKGSSRGSATEGEAKKRDDSSGSSRSASRQREIAALREALERTRIKTREALDGRVIR